jgi:multidrug efflux pump subunit AcrA (membrane-fusion protein)
VVAVAVVAAVASCSEDGAAGVRVAEASRATVTEVVEAPATVTARATATLRAGSDGTVARLRVREGQQVRAGQVLLRIESPGARRALRQAERADARAAAAGATAGVPATLAGAAQADAAAQRAFDRARRAARAIPVRAARAQALSALRVSQSQYEAARARADQAAAQLAAGLGSLSDAVGALSEAQRVQTRAAVAAARRGVRALTIRAPIAGTVSLSAGETTSGSAGASDLLSQLPESVQSQAGEALGAGSASVATVTAQGSPVAAGQPLVTITDASTLSLTAEVDETDVLLVRPGVPAWAELDAVPDARYAAEVTTIDPSPTTSTRGGVSYVVRMSLGRGTTADGSTAPTPRPGMSAVADLQVRTSRGAVAVPSSAVFRSGNRDAVWVVANGVARERLVRLGAQGQARVEVLEGVEEGEQLVVRGADRVREGQQVS